MLPPTFAEFVCLRSDVHGWSVGPEWSSAVALRLIAMGHSAHVACLTDCGIRQFLLRLP